MKRETFIAGMSTLSATFGRPLEDAALEGYWIGLSSIGDGEFLGAMRMALETCRFMPAPSELLGFAKKRRDNASRLEAMKLADEIKREISAAADQKAIEGEGKMIAESTLTVLRDSKRAYEIATRVYWSQRDSGGIVRLDDEDVADREEIAKGRRFKPVTPAGAVAFGNWQKCKAELDAANGVYRAESGDTACPVCPIRPGLTAIPAREPIPDSRLPPERDEDEG